MQTRKAIEVRHSCRSFAKKPVKTGLIAKIADCGRLAPTARNVQPWEFIAVTDRKILNELAQLAENGRFLGEASCCIAVLSHDTKYYLEDGAAATENMLLAATDLGLASCWVAGDKKDYCGKVKELLGVPQEFKLVSLIALGYPGAKSEPPVKKPLKDILHWEKF
ncbi:MAG: nitroreductase family protein [Candidatus Omnitrophota bacterium]